MQALQTNQFIKLVVLASRSQEQEKEHPFIDLTKAFIGVLIHKINRGESFEQMRADFTPLVIELRLKALDFIAANGESLGAVFSTDSLDEFLNASGHSDHPFTRSYFRSLRAYEMITQAFHQIDKTNTEMLNSVLQSLLQIEKKDFLTALLTGNTSVEAKEKILKWLQFSVGFEIGLFIYSFWNESVIELSQEQEQSFPAFLDEQILFFGAYALLTGFWNPKEEEGGPFVNKAKLLASKLEIESGGGITFDLDSFLDDPEGQIKNVS